MWRRTRRIATGGSSGFSLVEVMVAVILIAVVGGFSVSRLRMAYGRPTLVERTAKELVGNLRVARMMAISRDAHYRVVAGISTYQIQRLTFDGASNTWTNAGAEVRTISLPRPLVFSGTSPTNSPVEFDSRGLMVQPTSTATINLQDSSAGVARAVRVRLSGQILPPTVGTVY
jgi:prepilin-type N-terminal cleavage/methylation domain-containing protein